jgi:small-conductance mechanosensitive channel
MIKRIFVKRIFPQYEKSNVGTAKSYLRITTYIILFSGTMIAMDAAGVNFTILLAGSAALLVGIGFGIQSIANNFISGIILLIERPVKEGDFIEVDGMLGTVCGIGARSTKMETLGGITVIIPNSKLLENRVINRSYTPWTEIEIPLNISYGEDLDKVYAILLNAAIENQYVLKEPAPSVSLRDFKESFMVIKLFYNISEQQKLNVSRSQISKRIYDEFRKEGIKFPAEKRDVTISNSNIT